MGPTQWHADSEHQGANPMPPVDLDQGVSAEDLPRIILCSSLRKNSGQPFLLLKKAVTNKLVREHHSPLVSGRIWVFARQQLFFQLHRRARTYLPSGGRRLRGPGGRSKSRDMFRDARMSPGTGVFVRLNELIIAIGDCFRMCVISLRIPCSPNHDHAC